MNNSPNIDPKVKEQIIKNYLESTKGKQKLAESLVAPLRRRLDYQSVARKTFLVEELPMVTCPECDSKFNGEHPDNGCSLGHIYNIMET